MASSSSNRRGNHSGFLNAPVQLIRTNNGNHKSIPTPRFPSDAYRNRSNNKPIVLEEEVQMVRRMQEWGIKHGVLAFDAKHRAFWDSHLAYIRDAVQGTKETPQPQDMPVLLPEHPVDAIQAVFEQEFRPLINEGVLQKEYDRLAQEYPDKMLRNHPPFAFHKEERRFLLRPEFRNLRRSESLLNPFERFYAERMPSKERLIHNFVEKGHPFCAAIPAIVAHAACHFPWVSCVHCNAEGSIRWNAYHSQVQNRYWKKMVCENCCSVYDIKSAPSEMAIKRKFESFIDGGNPLDAFHQVKRELPHGAAMFIVMFCEEIVCSSENGGIPSWPIYVAPIRYISPFLKSKSFCCDEENPRPIVYSRIYVDKNATNLWFLAPIFEFDGKAIAASVIESL